MHFHNKSAISLSYDEQKDKTKEPWNPSAVCVYSHTEAALSGNQPLTPT